MISDAFAVLTWLFAQVGAEPFTYAAAGDSYASGDGAGSSRLLPRFDALCGRFSQAYPVQIANSTRIDVSILRNLACGGAVTSSVLNTQIPFTTNSDVVTVQVGGNEIDFFAVLNECVYQWRPFSNCITALAKARGQVQSQTFLNNFNNLVLRTTQAGKQDRNIMFLGYARFFNDRTSQCDHVSFSHRDPTNYLSRDLRRQLNEVVMLLNDVIEASADAHGARYVDVDKLFQGHRFCEQDAVEPDHRSSWFFDDTRISAVHWKRDRMQTILQCLLPNPFRDFMGLARTFHPTAAGHTAVAEEVVRIIQSASIGAEKA